MSKRVPGMSDQEMRASWQAFLAKEFVRTKFKVSFNGKKRNVFTDRRKKYLYVLDEKHGDLEVLEYRDSKGETEHIGSQEIEPDYEQRSGDKVATLKGMSLGKLKTGGNKHKYDLI